MSQLVKKNDLELILSGAAALQTHDASRKAIQELEGNEFPIEVVYELADTLLIPRSNIDSYLQTRFPSRERQMETLKEIGSAPNFDALVKIFMQELRLKSPLEEFGDHSNNLYMYSDFLRIERIEKESTKSGIFRKPKKIKTVTLNRLKLAHLDLTPPSAKNNGVPFGKVALRLDIYDPFFSEACKEKINELKKEYSKNWHSFGVFHSYTID